MDDELLISYDKELSYLRRVGAEFATSHPKIAGRLRLGADQIEDPHVSRLVESVAFLNARVRRKLEDDFPELTDSILGVLAPYFLAPIPSMSVVRFDCAPDLPGPVRVDRGTSLVTDTTYGEPCRYRTAYDVDVLPVRVAAARLLGPPFEAPRTPKSTISAGLLHVKLEPAHESGVLDGLVPQRLRFYLNGEFRHMVALYELILNDTVEVAVATSPQAKNAQVLPADSISSVGFSDDENVLPDNSRTHPELRMLSEYFTFPHKFLFFDLDGIDAGDAAGELHLFIYLRRSVPELEQLVGAETLALGCTPIVNLFERRAEPVRLTGRTSDIHLIADARHQLETEIYSVDSVAASAQKGGRVEYAPFYGLRHDLDTSGDERYWHAMRRPTPRGESDVDRGSEIYLSLVDDAFASSEPQGWVLETKVTCLNRDVPARLPFGGGHPRLSFTKGGGAITKITCLTAPTQTRRPQRGRGAMWKLVSMLSLHHASVAEGAQSAQFLRECLRLFTPQATSETRVAVEGVSEVESHRVVRRISAGGQSGFCRGLQVRITLDEERLRTTGLFLFGSILERFLAGACTINSFVETVVTTTHQDGELRRWKPRSGSRILL